MKRLKFIAILILSFGIPALFAADENKTHNAIIFVADGLRWGSVNPRDTPALWRVRTEGVHFIDSHSLFPTFTTPNASAIATGHYIGDTGVFGNGLMTRRPVPTIDYKEGKTSNITMTPFDEDDWLLRCIDEQFPGNHFLDEEALLAIARKNHFLTAAVGKLGPAAVMDIDQTLTTGENDKFPETIVIDDSTGWTYDNKETGKKDTLIGIPLPAQIKKALEDKNMPTKTPKRVQPNISKELTGTLFANDVQQHFMVDALTHVILPIFQSDEKKRSFVVVYWSRDPDGTQHGHGDSLNKLVPGINGPTCRNAVRNADRNLQQILDYLDGHGLAGSTEVFVTSDHGFSTISRRDLDASGKNLTKSFSATRVYEGKASGTLPPGFLAMDLAKALKLPLFDSGELVKDDKGQFKQLREIDLSATSKADLKKDCKYRLSGGNGWLGGSGKITPLAKDPNAPVIVDAQIVIAANGGSDLIYIPKHHPMEQRKAWLLAAVDALTRQDYISGIFTDDDYGDVPGALPMSSINLKGKTTMPVPAMVVNFKTFSTDPGNPVHSQVQIADTGLLQGQGMHGSFGRGDTYNNMAAIGPSFKRGFIDRAPISNADVAQTLAHVLKLPLNEVAKGDLKGRVIEEALIGHADESCCVTRRVQYSKPAENGQRTFLLYQTVGSQRYFHAAGFPGRTVVARDWEGVVERAVSDR